MEVLQRFLIGISSQYRTPKLLYLLALVIVEIRCENDPVTYYPSHFKIINNPDSEYIPFEFRRSRRNAADSKNGKHGFVENSNDPAEIRFSRRISRAATARRERLWPEAVIPYVIAANFSSEHKNLFLKAMRHWENHTCITFVPKGSVDKNYIMFTVDKCGCCSYVGRRGDGPQAISIGKNCDKFGIVVHELGHVVGFWHEHTRPDRDLYVDIFYKSIQAGQDYNFEKSKPEEVDSLGEKYDFASIMHYARDTFSRGLFHDTILPKPNSGFRSEIGQRIQLSDGDIRQAKRLYKCPACGRTFLTENDKITPSQPGYCSWRIIAPEGNTIFLNVTGTGMKLPSDSCLAEQQNAIIVRDGHTAKSPIIDKICGDEIGHRTIVSFGSRLFVEMKVTALPPVISAVFHSVCGGPKYADDGVIQSPRYPENYPPNSDCLWTIHVPKGHQVAVNVNYFHVEQHKDCIYDRLVFWEGGEENSGKPLSKLCGQTAGLQIITSESNILTIRFISDNSVQKSGFELEWSKELDECQNGSHHCEQICRNTVGGFRCECNIGFSLRPDGRTCENTCGGFLRGPSGLIESPNYPESYPPGKNCVWEIEAQNGYQIFLNFTHFNVEGLKTECGYDFVKIGERDRLCGEYFDPLLFTSVSNRLRIEFSSDSSVERSGFSCSFLADLDECQNGSAGCEHICENRIGSYRCSCNPGFELASDGHNCKEGGCFFELNDPIGEITSPNFPIEYPKNQNCTWHILTTPGHRISLSFTSFEMEEHSQCSYDRVDVYDGGHSASPPLGSFCGVGLPSPLISATNQLFITFASDASVNRRGFHATYASECGGSLTADAYSGYIYSHSSFSDSKYSPNMDCQWRISARKGRGVRLQFNSFLMEVDHSCQYDYIDVYDGDSLDSEKLFGRYCSDNLPLVITSTESSLLLVLHTDDSVEEKGFVAEYRESAQGRIPPTGKLPIREPGGTDILNNKD